MQRAHHLAVFVAAAILSTTALTSAGTPTTSTKDAAPKEDTSRWCAPEFRAVGADGCVADEGVTKSDNTLVIFLHGVVPPKFTWQWTQQRAMATAAKLTHFTALMPKAPLAPNNLFAWPTGADAQREYEEGILASWAQARRTLEAERGHPFEKVVLVGFSSGAYYGSSLALRGKSIADGFVLIAGGAKMSNPEPAIPKKPVYIGVCAKDKTTRDMARSLGAALPKWGWTSRTHEEAMGHMFTPDLVGRGVKYVQTAAAAL